MLIRKLNHVFRTPKRAIFITLFIFIAKDSVQCMTVTRHN